MARPNLVSQRDDPSGDDERSARPVLSWIDPAHVRANPRQPRSYIDEESLQELADSIREVGILQPIVVRPHPSGEGFQLVAGERRLRAAALLGLLEIPALVRQTGDDQMLREALLENLQRAQLNALEEAAAYQQLLEDFGYSHEELAASLGRSRPHISNTLRLLRLPAGVARRVAAGVISQGHARALLALPDATAMEEMAGRIVAEGLSVRAVEELVALGGANPKPRRPRQPTRGRSTVGLESFANTLADRLDTRVAVTMGQRKGKVMIEFAGVADLERIMELLAAGEASGTGDGESG